MLRSNKVEKMENIQLYASTQSLKRYVSVNGQPRQEIPYSEYGYLLGNYFNRNDVISKRKFKKHVPSVPVKSKVCIVSAERL